MISITQYLVIVIALLSIYSKCRVSAVWEIDYRPPCLNSSSNQLYPTGRRLPLRLSIQHHYHGKSFAKRRDTSLVLNRLSCLKHRISHNNMSLRARCPAMRFIANPAPSLQCIARQRYDGAANSPYLSRPLVPTEKRRWNNGASINASTLCNARLKMMLAIVDSTVKQFGPWQNKTDRRSIRCMAPWLGSRKRLASQASSWFGYHQESRFRHHLGKAASTIHSTSNSRDASTSPFKNCRPNFRQKYALLSALECSMKLSLVRRKLIIASEGNFPGFHLLYVIIT